MSDSHFRISPGRAVVLCLKLMVLEVVLHLLWGLANHVIPFFAYLPEPLRDTTSPAVFLLVVPLSVAIVVAMEFYRLEVTWRAVWSWALRPISLLAPMVFATLGGAIVVSEIDNLIQQLFPAPDWVRELFEQFDDTSKNPITGPLGIVFVGPIAEEIFFRGLVLHGLLRTCRPWTAITISAVLFAIAHLNPWQLAVAFGFGLLLGWVYLRTASLTLCIVGHVLNNGLGFIAAGLNVEIPGFNVHNFGESFQPWWLDLTGVALLGLGVTVFHRLAPPARMLFVPPPPLLPRTAAPPVLPENQVASRLAETKSLGAAAGLSEGAGQMSAELVQLVTSLAQRARAASLVLATAPTEKKNAALEKLADLIDASHFELLAANQRDLLSPEAGALTPASRERLTLDEKKLRQLAAAVREVVELPDPVGEVLEETTRPNGLLIRKLRVPIGVIGIIFESRPNVTVDCAILCLKSGNASILRGGKECFHTNMALAALIQDALATVNLPREAVQLVPTTDRAALATLLKLDSLIHCIIPRGGESLIRYVAENSTIPVIKHYKGVCFVYVDAAADLAMAESIVINAKCSRPSVCNAAEQLLVHRSVAEAFLPVAGRALAAKNVELRCDPASAAILTRAQVPTKVAMPADYTAEFLDYVLAVRIVDSLDDAIATINRDSSNHSDAIVTTDEAAARRFLGEVDSATVYWNASTRFTDGYEFGYGAEIGISTDRLHARGPMGLRELCTHKFVIEGTGQVR